MDFPTITYYIVIYDKKHNMDFSTFYMDFSIMPKMPVYKEQRFRSPLNAERQIGLWIDRIGYKNTSEKPSRLRQLGQYGVVYIEKGPGYLINSKMVKFPIKPGDLILLFPNDANAYYPLESWSEKWIVWNGPDAYKIEELDYINKSQQIIHDHFGIFSRAYDLLLGIIDTESKAAILERKSVILNMLLSLFKLRDQFCEDTIENVIIFLRKNFYKNASISELAERFNMSDTCFRRLFRNYTGRKPREFITSLRISKAKELLLQDKKIKEVANIVGYEDIFYFMRVFKKVTELSPGKWKKSINEYSGKT
jgi:AraC-like DNA-binding protein